MTREEARQAAEVMLAFAEGKKIECRCKRVKGSQWIFKRHEEWSFEAFDYRVAPEKWTGKIWVHPDGRVIEEDDCEQWKPQETGWRLITAKEVADE